MNIPHDVEPCAAGYAYVQRVGLLGERLGSPVEQVPEISVAQELVIPLACTPQPAAQTSHKAVVDGPA